MTDLTERLRMMRDGLMAVEANPDHPLSRLAVISLEDDRKILTKAANRIEELEAERDHYRKVTERASFEGYDAAKLGAERDRLREALEAIRDVLAAPDLYRAALNPEGEG